MCQQKVPRSSQLTATIAAAAGKWGSAKMRLGAGACATTSATARSDSTGGVAGVGTQPMVAAAATPLTQSPTPALRPQWPRQVGLSLSSDRPDACRRGRAVCHSCFRNRTCAHLSALQSTPVGRRAAPLQRTG